jgi:hypothetical protein
MEAWIGTRPSAAQIAANLFVGVNGILIAGLQPLLLGALAHEGRITAPQIGETATAELLMMGAACAYAGAHWKAEHLRAIAIVAAVILGGLDLLSVRGRGSTITLLRALAGVPSGILIWVTIAMIARTPTPERWSSIYLTIQTLAQFLVAAALTAWVVPTHGANGGFAALAGLCAVTALIAALLLPNSFAPLVASETTSSLPPLRGLVALTACFLYSAFIIGVWVYAEPLSHQHGHSATVAGTAVSISLACQVLGGSAATIFASRLRWFPAVLVCSVLNVGCLVAFANLSAVPAYLATAGVFGFLWLFVLPLLVPMVIAADPSRRSALLIGGAQLLGGSLGPLFASFVVTDADVRGALVFGLCALALSVIIMIALGRRPVADAGTIGSS